MNILPQDFKPISTNIKTVIIKTKTTQRRHIFELSTPEIHTQTYQKRHHFAVSKPKIHTQIHFSKGEKKKNCECTKLSKKLSN